MGWDGDLEGRRELTLEQRGRCGLSILPVRYRDLHTLHDDRKHAGYRGENMLLTCECEYRPRGRLWHQLLRRFLHEQYVSRSPTFPALRQQKNGRAKKRTRGLSPVNVLTRTL